MQLALMRQQVHGRCALKTVELAYPVGMCQQRPVASNLVMSVCARTTSAIITTT